jgi:cytidyltransferase-like protein
MKALVIGCWDLFHYGHAKMIQQCLEICPCLTIGVISDELIKKIKKHESAVSYNFRYLLLYELYPECEIIPIRFDGKDSAINAYDIVFVSSDMVSKPFHFIPDDYKGEIVYIPRTEGISSSNIRQGLIFYVRYKNENDL